ncbi:hypothetical protein B0H13DRAFT_2268015 [Mycena leptocephala]|nr:hypothetical protein B0H13DRAFT_2268015 [Mycena leptocephala]
MAMWCCSDCPLLLWGWCWDWDDAPANGVDAKDRADDVHTQMARDVDNTLNPGPPNGQPQAGFILPQHNQNQFGRSVSPLPPPTGAEWSPWGGAGQPSQIGATSSQLGAPQAMTRTSSPMPPAPTPRLPSPPRDGSLMMPIRPLPTLAALQAALPTVTLPRHDPQLQLAWPRDVLFLVDRTPSLYTSPLAQAAAAPTPRLPSPPSDGSLTVPLPTLAALQVALPTVTLPWHDPQLQLAWARDVLFLVDRTPSLSLSPLAQAAVPLVLTLAQSKLPEALYLRATFAASGAYPNLLPANPRAAFRDFEAAARAGHAPAWFRLARDYEAFSDTTHALDCLARGARVQDPAALHRLGVAHLLAQLGLPADPATALPYLHRLLALLLPPGTPAPQYARQLLERAAALHFPPAQYKLGHAFEFAVPEGAFPFDPLLSVQWYSLASQAGEAEADIALSKWFLCGAEGDFSADEPLATGVCGQGGGEGAPRGRVRDGVLCRGGHWWGARCGRSEGVVREGKEEGCRNLRDLRLRSRGWVGVDPRNDETMAVARCEAFPRCCGVRSLPELRGRLPAHSAPFPSTPASNLNMNAHPLFPRLPPTVTTTPPSVYARSRSLRHRRSAARSTTRSRGTSSSGRAHRRGYGASRIRMAHLTPASLARP